MTLSSSGSGTLAVFTGEPEPECLHGTIRRDLLSGLRVATLFAFCVGQVWLNRLATRPIYLATLSTDVLVLYGLVMGVAAPALLFGLVVLLRRFIPRSGDGIEAGFAAVLIGLTGSMLFRNWDWMAHLVAVGVIISAAYLAFRRISLFRAVAEMASPALLFFPAWFLWGTLEPLPAASGATATGPAAQRPKHIVWIVLDECCGVSLMNGQRELNSRRVPHIAQAARRWTWFRNGSSVHPRTDQAVPAMLTGRYPVVEQPPRAANHPGNLFERLRATGQYDLVVFEPFTHVAGDITPEKAPPQLSLATRFVDTLSVMFRIWRRDLFPDANPMDFPPLPDAWFGVRPLANLDGSERSGTIRYSWDTRRHEQVAHFLNCLTPREQPTLFFLHVALPHYPWLYLPSGKLTQSDQGLGGNPIPGGQGMQGESWTADPGLVEQNYAAYLAQLGYADRVIGEIVLRLEEQGLYDDCLFVLTGDHGVSFRPRHERRMPDEVTLADIMSVPLFVKRPGQTVAEVSDRNAEIIDLLPTVLSVIGLPDSTPRDGADLFCEEVLERPTKRFRRPDQGFYEIPATFEGRWSSLADLLGRMGEGSPGKPLRPRGLHADLVGRRVDAFAVKSQPGFSATVLAPESFTYQPEGEFAPCWFDAIVSVPKGDAAQRHFALALNGEIVVTGQPRRAMDFHERFAAFLPEVSLKDGGNRFELFDITRAGTGIRLTRVALYDVWGKSMD